MGNSSRHLLPGKPIVTLCLVIFSAAFLISRFFLSDFLWSEWYTSDDALDACIKPWQLLSGKPIFQNDTSYLSLYSFLLTYRLIGFNFSYAYDTTAIVFSVSLFLYLISFDRFFGTRTIAITCLIIFFSFPFITIPNFGTTASFGIVAPALALIVISRGLPSLTAALLPLCACASYFLYGSGLVTCLGFALCLPVFFPSYRRWRVYFIFLLSSTLGLGICYFVRQIFVGQHVNFHWGATVFDPSQYQEGILVVLSDLLISSKSWYSLNLGKPYLPIELQLPFVCFLVMLALRFMKADKPFELQIAERWSIFFIGSFLLTTFFASFASPPPGIRRVFPAVLPLFAVAAYGLNTLMDSRKTGLILGGPLLALILVLSGKHSWESLMVFEVRGDSSAIAAITEFLERSERYDKIYVLKSEKVLNGLSYACSLALDEHKNDRFGEINFLSSKQIIRDYPSQKLFERGKRTLIISEQCPNALVAQLSLQLSAQETTEVNQSLCFSTIE
jgi:hypothetical protein